MIRPRRPIEDLAAYAIPPEGRRERVRLDFNENTAGLPGIAPPGLPQELLSAYPEYGDLVRALATHLDVPQDRLLLTNGSEEGLYILPATFIEPGDAALTSRPTFVLIPYFMRLCGAQVREVPVRRDLSFDVDGLRAALDTPPGVKLAIFASPDNPTGAELPAEVIEDLCRRHPDTLFCIDEAYGEYTAAPSLLPLCLRRDNLILLRTFSKAWGLAGLRLGLLLGDARLLGFLRRVRLPYSINAAAVHVAGQALHRAGEVRAQAQAAMARKAALIDALRARGLDVHDGAAHFFLVQMGSAAPDLAAFCRERGVLVRDRSHIPETAGMVRVSAGTAAENDAFLRALDAFLARDRAEDPA